VALAETAELVVALKLQDGLTRGLRGVSARLDTLSRQTVDWNRAGQQVGQGIRNGAKLAAVGLAALGTQVAAGLQSLVELEKATAQTEAVIKSTGGVAGVSAEEVRRLAESYEALNATVSDETIQAGENLLLTFTAIGKDAFEPALEAALDLSVALGTDLDTAIKTVGKALSEPEKAMARLRRQGIILTKQEEKQVEAHLANNDALGAQEVILKALDKRYGGSFLAQGNTTAGKVAKFTDSIEDLQRALATALLPTVSNVADALTDFLSDPATIAGAKQLGEDIAKLFTPGNIREGIDAIKSGAGFLLDVARAVGPLVSTAVDAFRSLPPEIQRLAVAGFAVNKLTGGLVTNLAGGLIGAVLRQFKAAVVNVQGGVVNVAGGVPGGAAAGAAGAGGGIGGIITASLTGAAILGIGYAVGTAVVDGLGGPLSKVEQGQGRVVGEVAGVKVVLGQNQAALVRQQSANQAATDKRLSQLREQADRTKDDTVAAVKRNEQRTTSVLAQVRQKAAETALKAQGAGVQSARQTRASGAAIQSTIRANRPIVTTDVKVYVSGNSVTKQTSSTKRYGNQNGSRNQNNRARPD
jgi:hypothetical protein